MPFVSFLRVHLFTGQKTLKFILLFLLKDYILWLYGQVIETQEVVKGSRQDTVCHTPNCAAQNLPYIIHAVTDIQMWKPADIN